MLQCIRILFLLLLSCKNILSQINCRPKVAIIGGGIGGASASYFLTRLFNDNIEIDLFESSNLGGRLANIQVGKHKYEAGGAIMHSKNRYATEFLNYAGLKKDFCSASVNWGIWNGEDFVITPQNFPYLDKLAENNKFGISKLLKKTIYFRRDFEKIYSLQDQGEAFENVTSLLSAMNSDFPSYLRIPFNEHLKNEEFSYKIINEYAQAAVTINYGQKNDVHTFVGYVALLGMQKGLWSVKGGNERIPRRIINGNKNVNVIHATVKVIYLSYENSYENKALYQLLYKKRDDNAILSTTYDIVIIATPLTYDQENPIKFKGFPQSSVFKFYGGYQTTAASFINGKLNPFFIPGRNEINSVLSCVPETNSFDYVGIEYPVNSCDYSAEEVKSFGVWKVFTRDFLSTKGIEKIFSKVKEGRTRLWKAYPLYDPSESRHDEFKLYTGLYHVNAIEWAASAIEMSAIGGRNVAILAYNDFRESNRMECYVN